MNNKRICRVVSFLAILLLLIGGLPLWGVSADNTADEVGSLIDGIIDSRLQASGASTVQAWIDGSLTQNAGITAEWYVLALSQYGRYDFAEYETALLQYLDSHEVYAAASRQKYALVLMAIGSTDDYISRTLNDSVGQQGVMSWVYGLHMLTNGYQSREHSLSSVKSKLLSLQLADGGWAVMGNAGDVDVTAMAVQALAPHYATDTAVRAAVDKALALLSDRQLPSGGYITNGVSNAESVAQVMVAVAALGINGETDPRFIQNGNTLLDGLTDFRLADGSFCHTQGGAANETATMQALHALVAYRRMAKGQSGLYILDGCDPAGLSTPTTQAASSSVTVGHGTATSSAPSSRNTTLSAGRSQGKATATTTTRSKTDTTATVPSGTATTATTLFALSTTGTMPITKDNTSSSGGYKLWVSVAIFAVAVIVCVVLYLTKKRQIQNFILVFVVAALAIGVVWGTNIQTVDEFHNSSISADNAVGTVTLTIRCDAVAGRSDASHIPSDGVILAATECAVEEGDTVLDILTRAAGQQGLHLETNGGYVEGINHLYEFDFGDLSGWVYSVNGESPSVGCGDYRLSDGDVIEWQYTCALGTDVIE